MSHSFNRIWIHAVWSTKERLPLITPKVEKLIHKFMSNQFFELGCPVRIINGMPDHVHCLFLLNPQKSISEIIKHIKGGVSHYINQQNLIPEKFAWQTGYASFSVSESVEERTFHYIKNQKVHHKFRGYEEEVQEFLRLHNLITE